jgi:hypothetical protein
MNGWAFNKFENIWKKAAVTYFKILSLNLFEEVTNTLSLATRYYYQNWVFPKSEAVLFELPCSVFIERNRWELISGLPTRSQSLY